jgi:hypothetical protein
MKRTLVSLFVLLCLLATIALVQHKLTADKDASWSRESMSFLPQSDRLAPYLMGFQTTYAAYLWIKTILYFGSEYMGPQQYRWLVGMIDIVTRLNPSFYPAYEFAALFLPDYCKNPDAARVILERGISGCSQKRYKLLFYLGWIYHQYCHDDLRAAECLARAAREKGVPGYIAGLAATYYANAGKYDEGLGYLSSLYQTTEDPHVRKFIEEKLRKYRPSGQTAGQTKN